MTSRPEGPPSKPHDPAPIAVSSPRALEWWRPSNIEEAKALAKVIADSGLVPGDYVGRPGNVFVAMLFGDQLGMGVLAAMQNLAVINGRPALWGDAVPGLIKTAPDYAPNGIEEEEIRENGAVVGWRCTMRRRGNADVTRTFTVEDAKTAELWEGMGISDPGKRSRSPWVRFPSRMLQMRARAWAARDQWPDRLKGIAVAEEQVDVDRVAEFSVTATAKADPPAATVRVEPAPPPAPEDGAGEVDVPREPREIVQKTPPSPKRAHPGDVWILTDTQVRKVAVEADDGGLLWVPEEESVAAQVEAATAGVSESIEPVAGAEATPQKAEAPAEEDPRQIALRSLWVAAKDRGLDASAIMETASSVLDRAVFVSSDLTEAEVATVKAEIELRYPSRDGAREA